MLTILAGASGGIGYWLVNYPCDTVKSAIQADTLGGERRLLPALKLLHQRVGVAGLYSGVTTTLIRAAPANAAIFLVYEWTMKEMNNHGI